MPSSVAPARRRRLALLAVVALLLGVAASVQADELAASDTPETLPPAALAVTDDAAVAPLAADDEAASPVESAPLQTAAVDPAAVETPAVEAPSAADAVADDDYDPWQPFNERMFTFNYDLDRFLVRPAATVWDKVLPDPVQRSLARAFDNLETPRRLVNNLLQIRPLAAGGELARFVVNTTVGVVGLFDVAALAHLQKNEADMGETLGMYGIGAGPYLVLPFFPPLTVRDGIGRGIDGVLDPFGYLIPFAAGTALNVVNRVNERSLNLRLFADVEDTVLDLYSAVRNGYLQRRRRAVASRRFHLEHLGVEGLS